MFVVLPASVFDLDVVAVHAQNFGIEVLLLGAFAAVGGDSVGCANKAPRTQARPPPARVLGFSGGVHHEHIDAVVRLGQLRGA